MRTLITITLAVGIVGVASAYDLGNQAPIKPMVTYPENIPNPILQGGDTIATATIYPGHSLQRQWHHGRLLRRL